jgi:hypothetical protein
MDRLRKARTPCRTALTKTISELEAELAKEAPDKMELTTKSRKLAGNHGKLVEHDQKIMNQLLDDDADMQDLEAETEAVEGYEEKFIKVNVKVETFLTPNRAASPTPSSASTFGTANQGRAKKTYKLPKIEIKKFNGEIIEWLGFWSQFTKIHEDEELDDSDKFQYLVQAIVSGTRAKELVESYPQTAANYPKVIRALKERFGKETTLVRVYVRELLKLVINNNSNKDGVKVTKIFDKLECHLRALESLGVDSKHMNLLLYPMVESCLPSEILTAWQRSSEYGRDGSAENPPQTEFDYMMSFIKKEVEGEEQRSLAQAGFGIESKKEDKSNQQQNNKSQKGGKAAEFKQKETTATAAGLFAGSTVSCIFCDKPHQSQDCRKALHMPIQEKRQQIKEKKVCFSCLNKGHGVSDCKSFIKCPLCQKKHIMLMCPDLSANKGSDSKPKEKEQIKTETTHTGLNITTDVILQTIDVLVGLEEGKTKRARILFDNGSQRSYILTSTAQELECQSEGKISLNHVLFGGKTDQQRHEVFKVDFFNQAGRFFKSPELTRSYKNLWNHS